MDKRTIIAGALVVLGIVGLFFWGAQNRASLPEENLSSKSALVATETLHDFGIISMAQGTVAKTFDVMNSSEKDIMLESLTTSCMCTVAYIVKDGSRKGPFGMPGHGIVPKANEVIPAGGKLAIDVVYDPAAHGPAGVGSVDRLVYLQDETGAVLELEIKANVTP